MKVRNWLNAKPSLGEFNRLPSMTVPDQTMSIPDILDRYTRGLPIGGAKVPIFDEEDDLPDIRTLDLAEREEMAESFKKEIEEIRSNDAKRKAAYAAYLAEKKAKDKEDAKQPPKEPGKPGDDSTKST